MIPTFMAGKCRLLGGLAGEVSSGSSGGDQVAQRGGDRAPRRRRPWRRRAARSGGAFISDGPVLRRRLHQGRHGIWSLVATRTAASARFEADTSSTASGGSSANSRSNAISAAASSPTRRRAASKALSGGRSTSDSRGLERPRKRVRGGPARRRSGSSCRNALPRKQLPSTARARRDRPRANRFPGSMKRLLAPLNVGVGATRHLIWYLSYQITGETRDAARSRTRRLGSPRPHGCDAHRLLASVRFRPRRMMRWTG